MPDSSDDYNRLRDAIREVLNDRVDHVIYAAGTICHANIADTDWAYFAAARGAHLADHAVWSVVKDKMTSEYSTWVSISSLDTRVHTDISQVGYHAAKLYKSGWIVDMHLATRAHPLYDKIRFVSLEPVFVNTTLADRGIEEDILQNSRNAGKEGFLDLKYLVEGGSSERQEVLVDTGDLIYAAVIGINELTDTPEVAEEIGKKPGGFWSKGFPDTGLWFSSPTHGQGEREQNKMEGVRKIRDFDLGSVAFRGIDVP
uniref:Uncharacterized protein n=1 Tax=Chromera velia CCMP2878 TaxID=1169474 RepID=A0A0G4IBU4_9ALVE|eukprot:Cvel_2208.t1-p1 / transcript=Cvel_2208.t1 / gene=Cvel_2208 / organism=Chromera_velia_CCMP2878 / gene_product=hypothetical protein / transcript_product=hypothetical protein / location=Cvel_scaffold85:58522-61818(-) / protein_length=256 / sequence_SO=supercontig / SO=protein_coding / is_pseudo=false